MPVAARPAPTSRGVRLIAVRSDEGRRYLGVALRLDADQAPLRRTLRVLCAPRFGCVACGSLTCAGCDGR